MLDLHLSAVDPGFGWKAEYTPGNDAVLESGLTGEADTPEDAVAELRNRALQAGHIEQVIF